MTDETTPAETPAASGRTAAKPSEAATPADMSRNLELLLDIPLELTVEIGRTRLALGALLELGAGAVLELKKLAGEPLDVLVNGKAIARGEAVMVNDKFGVRLTDVISPSERVARLT